MTSSNGLPELPTNWVWSSVKELYRIVGGGTPSTAVSEYWTGDIPWITSADIHGPKDIRVRKSISAEAVAKSTTNLVPAGSLIVVTRVGLGKVAIAPEALCFSQDCQALVGIGDFLNEKFALYYLSMAVQIFKYQNRGTTISGVTKKQLEELPIPLAPLSEQKRIVEKIEELFTQLDAGIEELRKAQDQLRRYGQAVLKAAVTGELTKDWREVHKNELEPASQLLVRILQERRSKWERNHRVKIQGAGNSLENDDWRHKYLEPSQCEVSHLNTLPTCWVWARAEQLCDFITKGTTPQASKLFSSGEIPYIKVYNLTDSGTLDFSMKPTFIDAATHIGELARSRVYPGDVLMNIVGPPLGKVSLVTGIYPEWNINQAIAIFRPMPSIERKYLVLCLLAKDVRKWAEVRAKATAGQFNLTLEICRDLPIPLPPLFEQKKIVEEVERNISIAEALGKMIDDALKQSVRIRQSVLRDAFRGKLVTHDKNDEPADRLLELIKLERAQREAERKEPARSKRKRSTKKPYKRTERPAA